MKSIEFLSQITESKAKWKETHHLYQKKTTLLSKRDVLEEQIEEIKKNLNRFSSHSSSHQLNLLIREQRNIDHQLDELEELSLQEVMQAKEELLKAIFDSNSQYEIDYHIQQRELTALIPIVDNLQTIDEALSQLHHFLEVIEYGRQRVKGFGLLRYFVGLSPNRIIEHHLSQGALLIEQVMSLLDDKKTDKPELLTQLSHSLATFLRALHIKLNQRWGFKHLDQFIIPAKQPLSHYLMEIKRWRSQLEQGKKKKEKDLSEWIENISQESD